ncbi:hypothetical protein [Paenibacillus sp. Marseille-Q4541]|uniref:hypothetical protein n=1 Tax=Paenibacillus sp. Marseille-Q4541 TaxID=2831522 RepID=UPI001BA8DF01|nr:hypothetical protein [Paenibacillus sp. Marseille-Q4541]
MSTKMYRIIGLLLGLAVPFVFLWLKIIFLLLFLFIVYAELRKVQFPQSGIYFVAGMLVGSIVTFLI